MNLNGRVAIVTGASSGLGRAIARRIAELGGTVMACARSQADLAALVESASAFPGTIEALPVDLLDPGALGLISGALARHGRLDILVNNAGGPLPAGRFEALDDDAWQRTFELTFFAAVKLSRLALPYLRRSAAGRIVNVGTTGAFEPHRNSPHYIAAKAALHAFSKTLATEVGPDGITVNVLAPGRFSSRGRAEAIRSRAAERGVTESVLEAEFAAQDLADFPLGRGGDPAEIARAASFLFSDDAAWITGTTFVVDGGSVRSVR